MQNNIKFHRSRIIILLFFILIASCSKASNMVESEKTIPGPTSVRISGNTGPTETPEQTPRYETGSTPVPGVLSGLPPIVPDNVEKIELSSQIIPFFPPISAISGNQSVIALGDLNGVVIYDVKAGKVLMEINVQLPDCQYGKDAYLTLDFSGNFIAITTLSGIEVWQVGGGKIYQSAYKHDKILNRLTCGSDIPQIALSPQGELLAESGLGVGGEKYGDYFQIIDIQNNEVVYNWDGSAEMPHGHLQSDQYLGFSSDGQVLQTFDPKNYIIGRNTINKAFQFWSTKNLTLLDTNSDRVTNSVDSGALFFAVSENNSVSIFNKTTNEKKVEVDFDGCTIAYPCDVIFSPDAEFFAILERSNTFTFKRELMITAANVYELEGGEFVNSFPVLVRNKNGIQLDNNGEIVTAPVKEQTTSTWWTNTSYFDGFFISDEELIGYIPQISDVFLEILPYSGTCLYDLEKRTNTCKQGILQPDGTLVEIDQIKDGFVLIEDGKNIAQVRYPAGNGMDDWQIRLRAYNSRSGVGYFCLDRNLREETCVIMNFTQNEILHEQIDLFGFVFSLKNDLSVFIDREKKELNIFSETSGRLEQIHSYNAIGYPLKPALSRDENVVYYFVQNVDNDDLYLEEVSLLDAGVIRRFNHQIFNEIIPTTISVNGSADLVAIGDETGTLYFYDPVSSELIHSMKISDSKITDAIFSSNDAQLIAMDGRGVINILQIKK